MMKEYEVGGIKCSLHQFKVARQILGFLSWLEKSGYSILVREGTGEVAGVVIKEEDVYEGGVKHPKILYLDRSEQLRVEYLDYYDKPSRQYLPCTTLRGRIMIVTARPHPSEDDPSKFSWRLPPKDSMELKQMMDDISRLRNTISDLEKRLNEANRLRELFENDAASLREENETLKNENALLRSQVLGLQQRVRTLEIQLAEAKIADTFLRSMNKEQAENASRWGRLAGMDDIERLQQIGKDLQSLGLRLGAGAEPQISEIRSRMEKQEKMLAELAEELKKLRAGFVELAEAARK